MGNISVCIAPFRHHSIIVNFKKNGQMKHLPLIIVASWLIRNIESCNTYLQLSTCETLFDDLKESRGGEGGMEICKHFINKHLQVKRVELTMKEPQETN